jgi:hypothetical protein
MWISRFTNIAVDEWFWVYVLITKEWRISSDVLMMTRFSEILSVSCSRPVQGAGIVRACLCRRFHLFSC